MAPPLGCCPHPSPAVGERGWGGTGFFFGHAQSLVAQLVKNPPAMFDPWIGRIPWRREWLPTPVFWPGELHGLYSPRGRKESDTTERLSLSLTACGISVFPPQIESMLPAVSPGKSQKSPSLINGGGGRLGDGSGRESPGLALRECLLKGEAEFVLYTGVILGDTTQFPQCHL